MSNGAEQWCPVKGGGCISEVSFNRCFHVYDRSPLSSGPQQDKLTGYAGILDTCTQRTHPHRVHNTVQILGLLATDTAQPVVSIVVSTGLQSPLGYPMGGGGGGGEGLVELLVNEGWLSSTSSC